MKTANQLIGWSLVALGVSAIVIYILYGNWAAIGLVVVLAAFGRAILGFAEVLSIPLLWGAQVLSSERRGGASIILYFLASLLSRLGFSAFCIGVLWYFLQTPGPPPWIAAALAWTIAGAPFYWAAQNGSSIGNIDYPAANIGMPAAGLLWLAGVPIAAASAPIIALFIGSAIIMTVQWATHDGEPVEERRARQDDEPPHVTELQKDVDVDRLRTGDFALNPEQMEYFKKKLLRYRAEIFREMTRAISDLEEKNASFGWNTSEEGNEEISQTRNRYRTLMSKLDAALSRIEDGTYGYSAESGEVIELDLLEQNPVVERTWEEHVRWRRTHNAAAGASVSIHRSPATKIPISKTTARTQSSPVASKADGAPTKSAKNDPDPAVIKQPLRTHLRCPQCDGTFIHEGGLKYRMKCRICGKEFQLSDAEIVR